MFSRLKVFRVLTLVVILAGTVFGVIPLGAKDLADEAIDAEVSMLSPDTEADFAEVAPLSAEETEALHLKLLDMREAMVAEVDNSPASEPGLEEVEVSPTMFSAEPPGMEAYLPYASSIVKILSHANSRASLSGNSTLAEPAAVNTGRWAFMMGNTHAEYSNNHGNSWVNVAMPSGPSDAPYLCCDPDVVYDAARGVTFYSWLYLNAGGTNGVVRIFVRRTMDGPTNCSYTIDPAGASNDTVPDYPHLGLTQNHLYLTANQVGGAAGSVSTVRRFDLDSMADCESTSVSTYSYAFSQYGQRVFVPVEGATDTMYWGMMQTTTTFRLYRWPEGSGTVYSYPLTVSASTFSNPDCRGGINNADFIERTTAWSIAGFRMRGAVGDNNILFLWNVGADASHPQGHVHAVLIREHDRVVIGQPHVWNSTRCFGYPALAANVRGDFGLSIAMGGNAGGGGGGPTAARGYVGIDDDFTTGVGVWQTVYLTATGNYNRSDGRFGDYFTVRPWNPSGLWFAATNYSLLGGTSVTNVNARFVEFGRGRDFMSYFNWTWRRPRQLGEGVTP
jgi:hypothetical protein